MKTLLYIGNKLYKHHNATKSMMESHGPLLEPYFKVHYASNKKHKAIRFFDMVFTFLRLKKRIDCVIIAVYSTLNFYYAWVISQLCRLYKIPYIAYLHGGDLPARLQRSPGLSRDIFAHSHANVAPSGFLKAAFDVHHYPAVIIPNFIQIEYYPYLKRDRVGPRLLWVRSFEKTYHPEMTIRVFAEFQKRYPDAKLCMVGPDKDGSQISCKKLVADLGLKDHIIFTNKIEKPAWIQLSVDYDIFISTTHFDNTPVSVLEAMALGLPVVSTSVGGVPFIIEHGKDGLLSPDNDIAGMVNNLVYLLQNPSMATQLSRQARKKVELFDWKVVEQQWLSLIPIAAHLGGG